MTCLTFSASDSILASGSRDGTIHLWDVDTLANTRTFHLPGHNASLNLLINLTFVSMNSKCLIAGGDGLILVWDLEKSHQLMSLPMDGAVFDAYVTPVNPSNGSDIVFCSGDSINVWNIDELARMREDTVIANSDQMHCVRKQYSIERGIVGTHIGIGALPKD